MNIVSAYFRLLKPRYERKSLFDSHYPGSAISPVSLNDPGIAIPVKGNGRLGGGPPEQDSQGESVMMASTLLFKIRSIPE